MKTLIFTHQGWTVVASAWTVATNSAKSVEVCYMWSSGSGIGWSDASTGVARKTFNITIDEFIAALNTPGDVLDLRPKPIS